MAHEPGSNLETASKPLSERSRDSFSIGFSNAIANTYRMLVISHHLTTGQITFILRAIIQILSYGGLFLIGLIILGCTPRAAPLETHDMINRVVGKSTATKASLKWISRRILGKNRDVNHSSFLFVALVLSLLYGLFVSLSDIGFIGLEACTIAGSSYEDFPASIKSEADARALVNLSMLNGTDPNSVHSYRCDSSDDFVFNVNVSERICNHWHNSTYGNTDEFKALNNTDSDVLMPRNLARYNYSRSDIFDLNVYFVGATGLTVMEPTIQGGIATLPHATGVKMLVGVPQLSAQQKVTIPKTMAIEVDVGCLPLGTVGSRDTASAGALGLDFFVPDEKYKAQRDAKYTGPSYLKAPLEKTADAIRDVIRPLFNSSKTTANGYLISINSSYGTFDWQTSVGSWILPRIHGNSTSQEQSYILGNCTQLVHAALKVTPPPSSIISSPHACSVFQMRGSFFDTGSVIQGHSEMVCATSTSVNMVSAQLEVDAGGRLITSDLTRIPSDLNIVYASYYEVLHDKPSPGDTTWSNMAPIQRFTLADNPSGDLQHFIFQQRALAGASATTLTQGIGSAGYIISRVASSIIGVSPLDDATLSLVDSNYFSANNFSTAIVTKWAGGVGASYLLASLGYHGGAALGKEAFLVRSTGGEVATCYNPRYGIAFLPLILSAILILLWSFYMLVVAKLRETKKTEEKYGGLAPIIVSPIPGKPTKDTVLAWDDNGDHSHLRAMIHGYSPAETEMLASQEYFKGGY